MKHRNMFIEMGKKTAKIQSVTKLSIGLEIPVSVPLKKY